MCDIENILKINGNPANIEELKNSINDKLVPFIGAGISISYGYQGWERFLREILSDLDLDKSDNKRIEGMIDEKRYLDAAERIDVLLNNGLNEYIRTSFHRSTLNGKDIQKGILPIIAKSCKNLIITTNYDYLIEEAYKKNGIEIKPLELSPYVINKNIREKKEYSFIKLHGDPDDFNSLIFTKKQYEKYYGCAKKEGGNNNLELPEVLGIIWKTSTILFLGCSLKYDETVNKMKELAHDDGNNFHYAIMPLPEDEKERREIKTILLQLKIRPIWYPDGKHEYVLNILCYLLESSTYQECPLCGESSLGDNNICSNCHSPIVIKTMDEVKGRDEKAIYKYLNAYNKKLESGINNVNYNLSIGICHLKIQHYDYAIASFEKVIAREPENSDAYYYMAISLLKGNRAFLHSLTEIKVIIDYLNKAKKLGVKREHLLLLAYVKYDFYYKKGLNIHPDYKSELSSIHNVEGICKDVKHLFQVLRVECPTKLMDAILQH